MSHTVGVTASLLRHPKGELLLKDESTTVGRGCGVYMEQTQSEETGCHSRADGTHRPHLQSDCREFKHLPDGDGSTALTFGAFFPPSFFCVSPLQCYALANLI